MCTDAEDLGQRRRCQHRARRAIRDQPPARQDDQPRAEPRRQAEVVQRRDNRPRLGRKVRELVVTQAPVEVPALASSPVDLAEYDALLVEEVAA